MPAVMESPQSHNPPYPPTRRMIAVIPVIPQKFEKPPQQSYSQAPAGAAGPGFEDRRGDSPDNVAAKESQSSKIETRAMPQKDEGDDHSIKIHGGSSTAVSFTSNTGYSPQSQDQSGYDEENVINKIPGSETPTFASSEPPPFHSNPTPPIDDVTSPIDSYYRGYGHIPYTNFHPQPTPPSDSTPSPINPSFIPYNPTPTASFAIENHLSFPGPPPPVYSFYQGYGYGDVSAVFPPPTGSSAAESEHDSHLHARDEYQVSPTFHRQIENSQSSSFSDKTLHSEPIDSSFDVGVANQEVSYRANTKSVYNGGNNFNLEHSVVSQRNQEPEEVSSVSHVESPSVESFPSRTPQYEAWRHAVLTSLDQTPKTSPSNIYYLAGHLVQQFNTAEHADCHLQIFYDGLRHGTADFFLHGVLIAQSPLLQDLMKTTATKEGHMKLVQIRTFDRFLTTLALETALQVCYGKSIAEFNASPLDTSASKSIMDLSRAWMENALALVASGYLFQLDDVISRGLQIASSILGWENIETALSFALDGGLDAAWDPNQMQRFTTEKSVSQSDDTTEIPTPSTSQSSAADFELSNGPPEQGSPRSLRGTYSPGANDLLLQCLQFILSNFLPSWELDVSARPLADIDRLPRTAGSRSPLAKSRLSLICFGDHPSEWTVKFSNENVMLSSILLSIPYVLLKYIFDRQDDSTRARIVQPIVNERERRRRQALKCDSATGNQRQAAPEAWAHVGWEEFVGSKEGSRVNLQRKWTGFS